MNTHKTYFNWSTGKDSALALYYLMNQPEYSVERLVTTVNEHYDRVSMHGLRRSVMERQFAQLDIPFDTIELPEKPSMKVYEPIMRAKLEALKAEGFTHAGFGDIFLEDLKAYREKQLKQMAITAVFPLWKKDTKQLMKDFLELGFRAVVVTANADLFGEDFVGQELTPQLIGDLPAGVDPCGENGEFHTFCFDGPIFKAPVEFEIGEKVFREYDAPKKPVKSDTPTEEVASKMGFWYCDLL